MTGSSIPTPDMLDYEMIEVFEDDFMADNTSDSRPRLFSWPFSAKEAKAHENEHPLSPLVIDVFPDTSYPNTEVLFDADALLGEPLSPVSDEEGRRDCLGFRFSSPELGLEGDSPASPSPFSDRFAVESLASLVFPSSPVQGFSQFTPAQLIPFPEYREVSSSLPTAGFSSLEVDESSEPSSATIMICEADLESEFESPSPSLLVEVATATSGESPVVSPAESLPSFGGFSLTCESPGLYSCSIDSADESPASPPEPWIRRSESLTFDEPEYVQDFYAIMEEHREHMRFLNPEHILLPSAPSASPCEANDQQSLSTPAFLDQVSDLLNSCTVEAWTSAPATPGLPTAKQPKPTLKIVTDFSFPYPTGPSFAPRPTPEEQSAPPEPAPAWPAPGRYTSPIRSVSPGIEDSPRAPGAHKSVSPKDTYPQARKALGKRKGTISESGPEAKKPKTVRFADRPKKRLARKKLTRVTAERRNPQDMHPFAGFLQNLGSPKEAKVDGHASWIHPLLKPAQQDGSGERLRSKPTTQSNRAMAFGRATITFLSIAGLYFALQGGRFS